MHAVTVLRLRLHWRRRFGKFNQPLYLFRNNLVAISIKFNDDTFRDMQIWMFKRLLNWQTKPPLSGFTCCLSLEIKSESTPSKKYQPDGSTKQEEDKRQSLHTLMKHCCRRCPTQSLWILLVTKTIDGSVWHSPYSCPRRLFESMEWQHTYGFYELNRTN